MPYKDINIRREKQREYNAKYYAVEENRTAQLKRVADRNVKVRERCSLLVQAFRANGCALCGEKEPFCLDAHHRDPNAKDFTIGRYRTNSASTKRLEDELKKCVCLCANCHRKVHIGLLSLPSAV